LHNDPNNNIKQKTMKHSNQNNLSMNNINDNFSLYYKYLNYDKNNIKHSLEKNNSAPNIFMDDNKISSNINRKKFISNYLKRINNAQKGSSSNQFLNNDLKYLAKDNSNSFNNLKNNYNSINNINYNSKNNLKRLPYNNNIYLKNNNINLTTSFLGDNLNIEQLSEYLKLIDKKAGVIMKDKKTKLNKNSNISCDKENRKIHSPKSNIYRKISKVMSSSDFGRNKKNYQVEMRFHDTNYKNKCNENLKIIHDKISVVPKRLNDYEHKIYYNLIINKDNINKNKLKKLVKNTNVKGKIYLDSYNEMMNKKNIF
jgi:hypothetical protein